MRQRYDEANRWTAVEDELRAMLNGVAGANLIRRQRVAIIAAQASTISSMLARDPAHAVLVPHVQEIRRLKRFTRRKSDKVELVGTAGSVGWQSLGHQCCLWQVFCRAGS